MEIIATGQKDVEIKPHAFGQAVGDFLVRDYSERTEPSAKTQSSETQTRRFVYKLEPVHSGHHVIRSMAIEFIDNRPLSEQKGVSSFVESEPFDVNVTSELGDGVPNLADLEPMLPPLPLEPSSSWRWLIIIGLIAILGIAIFWFRRKKTTAEAQPYQQTPEEIAHAAFAALLAENLPARGLFKDFYLRLTGIVRVYIEGTTGLHAPEQTTEEFLREMRTRDVFTAERSIRLKEFLEAADMVKYAGLQPDTEQIELAISRAREFVAYQAPVAAASIPVPELTPTTGS
jgi:LPXTG-motif cell wall-anchored protein